jgi:hypothetical protein
MYLFEPAQERRIFVFALMSLYHILCSGLVRREAFWTVILYFCKF